MDYSQLIISNLGGEKNEQIDIYKIWTPTFPRLGSAFRRLFVALAAKHDAKPTASIPAE